jgi:hypothetical protein
LKLFDDTDAGIEQLVSFMDLVRKQSNALFSHPSNWFIQLLSGPFRPDLGAYFVGENLVATTHAIVPSLGFDPELLRSLQPGHFKHFGAFNLGFSTSLGEHFAALASVLGVHGREVNLCPAPIDPPLTVTHNDFVGARFYGHAEKAWRDAPSIRVPALTLCLMQVNIAQHVLPQLLEPHSNLLARVRYLAAYHGSRALSTSLKRVPSWLASGSPLLAAPDLRNLFAHYELRDASRFAVGSSEPFQAAIAGIVNAPATDVSEAVSERLARISDLLGTQLTKSALHHKRALLGDHC